MSFINSLQRKIIYFRPRYLFEQHENQKHELQAYIYTDENEKFSEIQMPEMTFLLLSKAERVANSCEKRISTFNSD